jgi:hypothetical protein
MSSLSAEYSGGTLVTTRFDIRSELVWASTLVAISFSLFLPFATLGIDMHHDGIMMKPALDVASGQMLHRDTFTQYGPLTTLTQALLLKIFGSELLVLRVATVAMDSLSLGVMFLCWRRLMCLELCLASAFLWMCLPYFYRLWWHVLPWSSSESLFFQSCCLCLMSHAMAVSRARTALQLITAAGLCASATFWCRQPVGALLSMAGAVIPMLLQSRFENVRTGLLQNGLHYTFRNRFLLGYIAGGVTPAVIILVWLAANSALYDWFEQNVLWPRVFAKSYLSSEQLYQCFFTRKIISVSAAMAITIALIKSVQGKKRLGLSLCAAIGGGWVVIAVSQPSLISLETLLKLIPLSSLLFVYLLVIKRQWYTLQWVFQRGLLLPVLVSWAQYYPVPCIRHMFWGVTPMVGLFVFLLSRFIPVRSGLLAIGIVFMATPLAWQRFQEGQLHLRNTVDGQSLGTPFQGMRPYRDTNRGGVSWYVSFDSDIEWFSKLREQLQEQYRDVPVLLSGNDAMLTLLTDNRENPGPYYLTWKELAGFLDDNERSLFIKSRRPLILIQAETGTEPVVPQMAVALGYSCQPQGSVLGKDMYLLTPPLAAPSGHDGL